MCDLELVLDKIMAEREANDRLRAEDPAAFEAKMRESLPTSKCTLRRELQGIRTQRAPRARRGRGMRRVQRGDRGAAALPQVARVSLGEPVRSAAIRGPEGPALFGAPLRSRGLGRAGANRPERAGGSRLRVRGACGGLAGPIGPAGRACRAVLSGFDTLELHKCV